VQLRLPTQLTSEEYVRERYWEKATLDRCPSHPNDGGRCGFRRHSPYRRVKPAGTWIARYYCPTAHETYGLLPDFLASHLSGTLAAIEAVAAEAEAGASIERVAEKLRPDIQLPGAVRWVRRRVQYVRRALSVAPGLAPALFAGVELTLRAFRAVLGAACVLEALRDRVAHYLVRIASPFGLRRWLRRRRIAVEPDQQREGAVKEAAGP
jgi:hypothetical protein